MEENAYNLWPNQAYKHIGHICNTSIATEVGDHINVNSREQA